MKRSFEKISSIAEGAATGGAGVHRLQDTAASKRNSKGLVSSERAEWCLSSRGRRRLRLSVSGPSINSISVLASEVEEGGESANQLVLELVGHKTTLAKWLLRALKEYIDNSKGKTDDFSMCTPPPAAKQTATADETAMTQADTDAEKAIFWFKKATEEGHRETQYQLALCYKNCDDDYRAFHWFKEAATKGHIEAQLHQANCYLKGLGTPCNRKGAVRIYSKIADGDSTFSGYASCKLALCYYDGLGVPSSKARAKELLFMAAEKGYEKAMKLYKKICQ
eukprot:gene31838-38498_t